MNHEEVANLRLLECILDAFNRHDLDAILDCFADNAVMDMPRGPHPRGARFTGIAEIRQGLETRFTGIPDVHYGDASHWVGADRGVSEWLLTGTTGTNERLEVRGCDHWTFREGLVIRKDSYWKRVDQS